VAPAQLVEELAHVIAMVSHSKMAFDHFGNSLCGPQLRPISMCHGPFGQETNQLLFLLRGQPGRPTGCGLGLQGILPAGSHRISPTKNAAGVAADASGDFMKGEFLFEEGNRTASAFFQGFWRTLWSHGDTPYQDISIVLHYLCGSQ
jgi:hypothetical protein